MALSNDLVATGWSFTLSEEASYLLRFDSKGNLAFSKRIRVDGTERIEVQSTIQRASGDLAIYGTYDMAPEYSFWSTCRPKERFPARLLFKPTPMCRTFSAVAIAELPTSGFVTLAEWTPYHGASVELSTLDSLGARVAARARRLIRADEPDYVPIRVKCLAGAV